MKPGEAYHVRAVERAAQILDLLRTAGRATLKELAHRSGLPKPSVFRMVRTLESVGLVERLPESESYRLGVRCLTLGQAYLEETDLRTEARPILEQLREDFDETIHLAVLDDELRVVYLDKLETAHAVGLMMSRIGKTVPSFCTGIGKAMLANQDGDPVSVLEASGVLRAYTTNTIFDPDSLRTELEVTRKRGYALDLGEHESGVRCVASPIRGPYETAVAAISIAGPSNRLPKRLLQGKLAEATVSAARAISRRLGAA